MSPRKIKRSGLCLTTSLKIGSGWSCQPQEPKAIFITEGSFWQLWEKVKNEKASVPKNDYETQKKLKSLQNKQSKVEREIADLEQELKKIDQELEHNYDQMIAQPNFFEGYHGKKDKLAVLLKKWEVVAEELMELE